MQAPVRGPHYTPSRNWTALLFMAGGLIVPSLGLVLRYGRAPGLILYGSLVAFILWVWPRTVRPWVLAHVSSRAAVWLTVALFVTVAAAVVLLYPLADSGALGGGSDRDDALNIGVNALLRGQHPYHAKTYLDNYISPLPGAFLLAAPFVVLFGSSGYQNLFWLVILYLVAQRYLLTDRRDALLLLVIVLGLSPALWQELLTGGDLLANSLYVCAFTLLMVSIHDQPSTPRRLSVATSVLLGIGLASRANFALVLLPVFLFIMQRTDWRRAAVHVGLAIVVAGLLVIPFYLADPPGFTPLRTRTEIGRFDPVIPHAATVFALLMGLTALLPWVSRQRLSRISLLYNCAAPQIVPVVLGLAVYAAVRRLDTGYPSFGLAFMFFAALGAAAQVAVKRNPAPA